MICISSSQQLFHYIAIALMLTGLLAVLAGVLSLAGALVSSKARAFLARHKRACFGFGLAYPAVAIFISVSLMTGPTVRSQITEGLSIASASKTAVSEYFARTGELPSSNEQSGIAAAEEIQGIWTKSVSVGDRGVITVTFVEICDNHTIIIAPSTQRGRVSWDCRGGTLPNKYRPSSCR